VAFRWRISKAATGRTWKSWREIEKLRTCTGGCAKKANKKFLNRQWKSFRNPSGRFHITMQKTPRRGMAQIKKEGRERWERFVESLRQRLVGAAGQDTSATDCWSRCHGTLRQRHVDARQATSLNLPASDPNEAHGGNQSRFTLEKRTLQVDVRLLEKEETFGLRCLVYGVERDTTCPPPIGVARQRQRHGTHAQ